MDNDRFFADLEKFAWCSDARYAPQNFREFFRKVAAELDLPNSNASIFINASRLNDINFIFRSNACLYIRQCYQSSKVKYMVGKFSSFDVRVLLTQAPDIFASVPDIHPLVTGLLSDTPAIGR